jgi:hypothetical protein
MKPENRDKAYYWDRLQAADEAQEHCRRFIFANIEHT